MGVPGSGKFIFLLELLGFKKPGPSAPRCALKLKEDGNSLDPNKLELSGGSKNNKHNQPIYYSAMKGSTMNDQEYSETLKSIRHYSNLRFALLTLYSTATAGILSVVFGGSLKIMPFWGIEAFKFGGLLFSICFLFFEILLSKYLNALAEFIKNRNNSHYLLLPDYGKNYVSWLFRILYLSIILFWLNTILIKI